MSRKWEAVHKHTLLTTIRAAALARNQYWTAAAWPLERKYPDEYGKADRRRDEDEGGDDGAGGGPGEGGGPSRPRDDGASEEGAGDGD